LQKAIVADLSLRTAGLEDEAFLLAIRNSADVRLQSKAQELIAESTHKKWFRAQLGNPGSVVWILEYQGQREGYLRAQENESGRWLLSIALQTNAHGRGHGTWAVREGCRVLDERYGARSLVAEVLAENTAARRFFKRLGFVEKEILRHGELDLVRFELDTDGSHRLSIQRGATV
jgi:RimJ/RimL family protein N-acetyltransferase